MMPQLIAGFVVAPARRRLFRIPRTRRVGLDTRAAWFETCEPRLALSGESAIAPASAWTMTDGRLPRFDIGTPAVVDVWVDPAAGSDAAAGFSPTQPLRTVTEAWRRIPTGTPLSTGVRINLLPGTYTEASIPNYWERRHGTFSAPIIVTAAAGAGSVRLPSVNVFDCHHLYLVDLEISAGGGDVLHFERCSSILVRGTTVRGTGSIVDYAVPQETLKANQCRHIYVEDCDISGAWDNAIDFVAVQHGHVVGSRIHRAGDWAMYAKGGSAHLVIAGNEIFDAGTGGFTAGQGTGFEFMVAPYLTFEASDIAFVHNVVHDTQGAGFGVNGGSNILLAHNTLYRVGARSHVIEVVHGLRSCDGDVAACTTFLAVGGWGTNVPGREESIPNENVSILNNVVLNPEGFVSQWQQFAVAAPRTPTAGSNIPAPARADTGLVIRGNVIWNGAPGHALGIDSPALAADIAASNAINSLRPVLVDPARGDYRLAPGFTLPNPVPLPPLPGGGSAPPVAPPPVTPSPGGPVAPPTSPAGVVSIVMPQSRVYRAGEQLVFQVVMSEAVVVRGRPRLAIDVGSGTGSGQAGGSVTRLAKYTGGTGTDRLTFVYTVSRRDHDPDGIALADGIRLPRRASLQTLARAAVAVGFATADSSGIVIERGPRRLRVR
jgi:hypothetical protein